MVKKTDTLLLLFQIQIKITGFESPFRKRFSKAFLGRSVDERSEFVPQATSEVCTPCNAQNSYQLHKKVLVKKTDTFLLLFQIQIKITGFESPFRKRFSKAFLGRSVDERSEFVPQATSEVCTPCNAQNSYQLHKKVLVKKTDTFYCCLENNTVTKSKLINIILVQSILICYNKVVKNGCELVANKYTNHTNHRQRG